MCDALRQTDESLCNTHIECPICLDDITQYETITLPCKHTFHCACMNKWSGGTCPLCRAPIEGPKQTFSVDDAVLMTCMHPFLWNPTPEPHEFAVYLYYVVKAYMTKDLFNFLSQYQQSLLLRLCLVCESSVDFMHCMRFIQRVLI